MLPDITVLGPYTYIVTEVVFGSVALALLVRAGAVRRAARTVAALYPIAYVWDWYTLEVGVFDIVARTGIDLLGIPIEEHIFMVVVPALVIGFHETIHGPLGEATGSDAGDEAARRTDGDEATGSDAGDEAARRTDGDEAARRTDGADDPTGSTVEGTETLDEGAGTTDAPDDPAGTTDAPDDPAGTTEGDAGTTTD
ncbi:hypothetical protein BRD00_13925 [Halobacteriales archaeon QS_8_69_26]|nr:MAG: hypothetical protein BRD00_13925 [Halobacteriales archaeon QS_8_69_26]